MKRIFDLVVAGGLMILLTPLLVVIALLVRLEGRPVLFRQQRAGLGGRSFTIVKFRTMQDLRAPDGSLLPDDERITVLGRWLRALSLDELPELVNVLRGDMSLVGPRPLMVRYLNRYTPYQARRHEVRPGLTGWAQVNGRNSTTWEERFRLDVWYVDNRTFWLDLVILAKTVAIVFGRKGIGFDGGATMPEFTGDPSQDRQ